MRILRNIANIILLVGFNSGEGHSQTIRNPDLNGDIWGLASLPYFWLKVPKIDVNCHAYYESYATPDLTDVNGPVPGIGLLGKPNSGATFVSGVSNRLFHEGIMQHVVDFDSGQSYSISFYQSVVQQVNCIDKSGSWGVYADTTLVGISEPTVSQESFNSINLDWQLRSIVFKASKSKYWLKFLPIDDDPNLGDADTTVGGCLRMGIDGVFITPCQTYDPILPLDTSLCEGDTFQLEPLVSYDSILWDDGSSGPRYDVVETGQYSVQLTHNSCTFFDTVRINFESKPESFLESDTSLCEGDSLILDVSHLQGGVIWPDSSTKSKYTVYKDGQYVVQMTTNNCRFKDSINVRFKPAPFVDLGRDIYQCNLNSLEIAPQVQFVDDYLWQDHSRSDTYVARNYGVIWLEVSNECGTDTDSMALLENCSCHVIVPNAFSPNADGVNDRFMPEPLCELDTIIFTVFNRWGELLYTSYDLNNAWTGRYKGVVCPQGTYLYLFKYKESGKKWALKSGTFTLLK